MNQKEINFLKMVFRVITGMNTEKEVWENETEVVGVFTHIESGYNAIEVKNLVILGTDTTGYTVSKNNLFDSITHQTHKLVLKMRAYAKIKKDYVLLPLVDLSYSGLSRGIEIDAINRCQALVDTATSLMPKLANFKVTEPMLTAIRNEIKEYNKSMGSRSTAGTSVIVSGGEIDEEISSLRSHLDTLDSLIEGVIEDESFIARYNDWRKIIDDGTGKTLPKTKK